MSLSDYTCWVKALIGFDNMSNDGSGTWGGFFSFSLVSTCVVIANGGLLLLLLVTELGFVVASSCLISSEPSELLGLLGSGGPDGSYG